jgi:hypothetical protein
MKTDPAIEEIRVVRRRISEACGHDPKRLVQFYQQFTDELKQTGRYRFIGRKDAPNPSDVLVGA